MKRLNLATRPFRNEALPALALGLAGVVLVLLTVQHALTIRALLPARTSAAHRKAEALEAEAARLREEARTQRVVQPESSVVTQWTLLKELVDRRAFSWTGLFGVLEQVLPPGVRLLSVSPRVERGAIVIELMASTRSYEDGLELIRVLEERPEFANVFPLSRSAEDDTRFRYTMRYVPDAGAAPSAPGASPAPAAEDEAAGEEPRAAARLEPSR